MEQNRMVNNSDCSEKWQQEYACKVKLMNNKTLLQNVIWDAVGDDYDGCFTKRGLWEFKFLVEELNIRLLSKGWIKERVES